MTRSDPTAEGNRRASVAPDIGPVTSGATLSPYGTVVSVGLDDGDTSGLVDGESVGLDDGDTSGLVDGESVGLDDGDTSGLIDGESDGLGDGDVTAGKAFAIALLILAIVAAFRYAG